MAGTNPDSQGTAAGSRGQDDAEGYAIRPYRASDREAYLRLHERAFGGEATGEWFAWKYEDNPFVDHVPVTVAERDGEVVGAVSGFPLGMHTGSRRVTAYVSCEGFVHPAHRRRGVFTRMVRAAWDRHAALGIPFVFGLSGNEKTLSAHVKYNDWRHVGPIPRYYRFQRPGELLRSETGSRVAGGLGRLSQPLVRGYLRARPRLGSRPSGDATVRRYEKTPSDLLASLYRRHVPEVIHTVRDETFLDWRFENPETDYTTYVAYREASPVASIVASTTTRTGVTTVHLMDALPMENDRVEASFEPLLSAVLDDHEDAHVVSTLPDTLPAPLLTRYGFVRQNRFPLDRLTRPIYHGVRPLDGGDSSAGTQAEDLALDRLRDASSWRITFLEHDTK